LKEAVECRKEDDNAVNKLGEAYYENKQYVEVKYLKYCNFFIFYSKRQEIHS
jgi:hypothetical protein